MEMMEPNNNAKTITDDSNRKETLGALISSARTRAGLSQSELAGQVNLLIGQITALETDRFELLPGAMFVRAYLRNIARVLAVDEAALMKAYQEQLPLTAPAAIHARTPEVGSMRRPISLDRVSSARRHWGLVVAALVVTSLWGWQQRGHDVGRALSLTPDAANGETTTLPGGIEEALSGNAETRLMDSVELLPPTKTDIPAASPAGAAPSADSRVAQQQLAAGDSKIVTAEGDQLSLRFSADCWVEIKDRDNRVLVASLKHADERLQLQGRGPFRVLLGFAPGVEMAYNGTPVNIEVSQGSRSTRLIVGSS
jgi:cytoskeleton protein RodZ